MRFEPWLSLLSYLLKGLVVFATARTSVGLPRSRATLIPYLSSRVLDAEQYRKVAMYIKTLYYDANQFQGYGFHHVTFFFKAVILIVRALSKEVLYEERDN